MSTLFFNELKEVTTSSTLNPQKFSSLRCKTHLDQFITCVSLENSRDEKLFCQVCLNKNKEEKPKEWKEEKEKKEKQNKDHYHDEERDKNGMRLPLVIDFKLFIKNLYTFCTLDENDPGRFSADMVSCIEGARQSEKLKMFMGAVQGVREELQNEFSDDVQTLVSQFSEVISLQISQIQEQLMRYVSEQLEGLMSREALAIKQFKERGCKLVLSAVKTASLKDDAITFENVESSIRRLHSGKIEISYAREHAQKLFKQFTQNLSGTVFKDLQDTFFQSVQKAILDFEQKLVFLPSKKPQENSKSIHFQYLYNNNNPLPHGLQSIQQPKSRNENSFISQEKIPLSNKEVVIPKINELHSVYLDDKSDFQLTHSRKLASSDPFVRDNMQADSLSLFAKFSHTLRQTIHTNSSHSSRNKSKKNVNKTSPGQTFFPSQFKPEDILQLSTGDHNYSSNALAQMKSSLSKENLDDFHPYLTPTKPSHSLTLSITKNLNHEGQTSKTEGDVQNTVPSQSHKLFEKTKTLSPLKRAKTLKMNQRKEQNAEPPLDYSYCLTEKPMRHEIIAVIRVPHNFTGKSNQDELFSQDNTSSCSFILGEADGHLNVFSIEGEVITKGSRERAHKTLNGISFGKTKSMFFTAGEASSNANYASIKLWVLLSDSKMNELVEVKLSDQIVKGLFFAKETMRSNLNRLSICIWGCSRQEPKKGEKRQNELNGWNLNFASNGSFEGAKMQTAFSLCLLPNIEGVVLDDDGVITYTKKSITQMTFSAHFDCLYKKGGARFPKISGNDQIVGVRRIERSKQEQGILVLTTLGQFYVLSDQLAIVYEKTFKDSLDRVLNISKLFLQESDVPENSRFIHCYSEQNKTLYVFEGENVKQLDEVHSKTVSKEAMFYKGGRFLLFDGQNVKICKPLELKQNSILFRQKKSFFNDD